jgi:hypothetical protein
MRTTTEQNYDAGTEHFKMVPENIMPMSPSDVTISLTLPQRTGGEMYGM